VTADTSALMPAAMANVAAATKPWQARTHLAVIDHGLKAMALQRDQALRVMSAAVTTAQVLPQRFDDETIDELWQMQTAIGSRFIELQRSWVEGWFGWVGYARQIEGANTMSKLAEREYNLAAQAVQLAGEQYEDLLGLMENVQIGYHYWISRKGQQADA
jgi:hypothetical protein